MTEPVQVNIFPATDRDATLWRLTLEIAGMFNALPWVLVGGQMVAILEAEHRAPIGFSTGDVDVLIDVRALVGIAQEGSRRLLGAGFEPERSGARGYRFVRGDDVVDVLAPDHVGVRADLRTVPPDATISIVGGRQALARARIVEVQTPDGAMRIPVPTLAGAIVIKGRVASVALVSREKHERDLARLLALIPDVMELRAELTETEVGYLRRHRGLLDIEHPAWRRVRGAEDGATALAFITRKRDE